MLCVHRYLAALALLSASPVPAEGQALEPAGSAAAVERGGADQIVEQIEQPALRALAAEVLERSPAVAAARARARAARQRAPQVGSLPDPVANLTAFLATPETRTGPQRAIAAVSQGLPWFGKLGLRERAATAEAAALEAEVEAKRLAVLTECRRLYHELGFLDRQRQINEEFRSHLLQHEEISRARYATGVGLGQGVVKLQAAITRVERELLEIDRRRLALAAQINGLRDRPATAPLPAVALPRPQEVPLELELVRASALRRRPEVAAAELRIARAEAAERLAEKGYRPDFTVGLTYTLVDPRDDAPGRLQPPPGNGDDIFGVQAGITLPVRRKRLAAAVSEALELRAAAEEAKREVAVAIETAVGDLIQRVPLSWRQLRLVEDLLVVQAEEALESAQAGYVAGTLNALDLLDAEHVLFDAHTAQARAATDYLTGLAQLEGALGGSLTTLTTEESSK